MKTKVIHCSPLIRGASPLITQGSKVGQISFGFDKGILALPSHHLVLYVPENAFCKICFITFPTLTSFTFLDLARITPLFHEEGQNICEFATHQESPWLLLLSKMKKALLWQSNQVSWHPWMESIYCLWLMHVLSSCIAGNASLAQSLLLCSGEVCRQNLTVKMRQKTWFIMHWCCSKINSVPSENAHKAEVG